MNTAASAAVADDHLVEGEFVEFDGERYYVIRNVDRMQPFFVSIISNVDHWLFISSTDGWSGIAGNRTFPLHYCRQDPRKYGAYREQDPPPRHGKWQHG